MKKTEVKKTEVKQRIMVEALMSPTVVTCGPKDTESRAAQLMWENDCGVVPVVDHSKRVLGVVTDRDLCMGAYTSGSRLAEMEVRDSMSEIVVCCSPKNSLEQALDAMSQERVHRVPVVDAGQQLVGILSMNDVFRHVAGLPPGDARRQLESRAVQAMASICEPHPQAPDILSEAASAHAAV